MNFFSGDCGAFLLRYLEVLAYGLDVNSYCQQDHVTQFRQVLAVKLFRHRSWKKTLLCHFLDYEM